MTALSNSAWAVLHQLKVQSSVEDGDIISKSGRDELIAAGYAVRTVGHRRLAATNLTTKGQGLAAKYQHQGGRA